MKLKNNRARSVGAAAVGDRIPEAFLASLESAIANGISRGIELALDRALPRVIAALETKAATVAKAPPMTLPAPEKLMNGKQLAAAIGLGEWGLYAVKKANSIFHSQGREDLIFHGRLSTPARILEWLQRHPDFIARDVVAPRRKGGQS